MIIRTASFVRIPTLLLLVVFGSWFMLSGCSESNAQDKLDAKAFAAKLATTKGAELLDVRTPGEFSAGIIAGARNLDYNSGELSNAIPKLSKDVTYFVYCRSGARSASAASEMRKAGLTVVELKGGIGAWIDAGNTVSAPSSTESSAPAATGLTDKQFAELVGGSTPVLVDFNAPWCGPCKKLHPILDEIEKESNGKLKIVRINVDENTDLANAMKIGSIPLLHLYKNGKKVWENLGLVPKETITTAVKPFL